MSAAKKQLNAMRPNTLVIVFFLLDRYNIIGLGFLWLNVLGTLAVAALAYLFSFLTKR